MSMEVLKGTATNVRHTISVSGGGESGVSTAHYTIFRLGRTTVIFTSHKPAVISEGDRLIVAGRRKGQVLTAEAYANETTQLRGDAGRWTSFAGMLGFLLLGAVALIGCLIGGSYIPEMRLFWLAIGAAVSLLCGSAGLYWLWRWQRIRRAVLLLQGGAGPSLRFERIQD